MTTVLLIALVLFFILSLRHMRHVLVRTKISKEAGAKLIREFMADVLAAWQDEGVVRLLGPVKIQFSKHPEWMYKVKMDERILLIAHMPKKGKWWVKFTFDDGKGSRTTPEETYRRSHALAPLLESFVNTLYAKEERAA